MDESKDKNVYSDSNKWVRIANTTLSNYSNMNNRLVHNKKIAESVLVYYSVAIIILSITAKYFPNFLNTEVAEYFGIVCSVVLLAYSLVNNTAKYDQRIAECQRVINEVKTIKREIRDDMTNIEEFKSKYYSLIDTVEVRDDIDFFRTLKQQCKEYGVSYWKSTAHDIGDTQIEIIEIKNHLSEINIFTILCRIVLMYLTDAVLLLFPIIVFFLCILFRFQASP